MSRVVLLAEEPRLPAAIGHQLAPLGGVIAHQAESVITVLLPSLGSVVVNGVVGDHWADHLVGYGDTVGVGLLAGRADPAQPAGVDGGPVHLTGRDGLDALTATARRSFGHVPIVVGLPGAPDRALAQWLTTALGRPPSALPVYRVDGRSPRAVALVVATLLAMADHSRSAPAPAAGATPHAGSGTTGHRNGDR